jgi:ABC-type nitrate/sulfonate/bicarbonate transport system ATPase subunit
LLKENYGRSDTLTYINVSGVTKSFPSAGGVRPVLQGVSLSVARGEFVSIVGAMGSGKSTLLSILAGLTSPDAGTVTVDGEPVTGVRSDAAFVFQNYSLLPWFTALENVRLAVGAARPDLSREEQRRAAVETLERVGLGNAVNRRPRQLSGGMRQRVALARAFATRPQLLFMDEPFGALDALTRETLQQDLASLCSDASQPVTVVMITNSVEEAILLSDRIVPILPGPPATLGTPIAVELARPRSAAALAHEEQAMHVRATVISTLTAALRRPRAASHAATTGAVTLAVMEEGR